MIIIENNDNHNNDNNNNNKNNSNIRLETKSCRIS